MGDGAHIQDLTKLPVFDSSHSNCVECELQPRLQSGLTAFAYRPPNFNGVMVVGEGPGNQEVAQGRPFVGRSGQLLRAIMSSVGLDMDACYITNATTCKPPPKDKSLHASFPNAIPSCLSRLEDEIEAVRPRVIVCLGAAAFIAVTGYDKDFVKRVRFDCEHCDENRRVGPVLECSAPIPNPEDNGATTKPCRHLHFLNAPSKEEVDPEEVKQIKAQGCASCGAKLKNVRPKMVKCRVCGGRKMRHETHTRFEHDYNVSDVAGALFVPSPTAGEREAHQVDHWYAEQGVGYVIGTYHPAFLLRGQQFMAKAVQKHLAKAKRLVNDDVEWVVNYETTTRAERVREYCWAWERRGVPAYNFSVDIETEAWGFDEDGEPVQLDARVITNVTKIKVIGIGCWQMGKALVVDTRAVDPAEESALLDAIQDFLEDERIPKTYQNGACYDIPVVDLVWGIPWENQIKSYWDDTLGAHTNLYPDEPHNLPHITFSFTDAYAWKPARTVHGVEVHENFEELALYNARDVLNTDAVREAMGVDGGVAFEGGKMHRAKLGRVYELDARLRQICVSMTMRGMPLDPEMRARVAEKANGLYDDALLRARSLIDKHTQIEAAEEFNPNSPPQLVEVLFSRKGFNLMAIEKTDGGVASTKAEVLEKLLNSTKDTRAIAFLKAMKDVREHSTTLKMYINSPKMQPWADGRMHSIWQPWGAKTGRFSSKPNFQNWPGWLRAMIAAAAGRHIVGSDYDQLELRGMAALYGDPELIRRCLAADENHKLEPDHDPHSYVAWLAFKDAYTSLDINDPTHDPEADERCRCQKCKRKALRDLIKRVIYGLGYGAGDSTVLNAIYSAPGGYHGPPITLEMVAHVRKTIFKAFPEIPRGREKLLEEAHATQEIRSPLDGRRRVFPLGDIPPTEIYNYPIQSMGASIINERTVVLYDELPHIDPTAFIFAQVHDAVYIECDEDKSEAVAKLTAEVLTCEKSLREGAPPMIFSAGAHVATNWKDA